MSDADNNSKRELLFRVAIGVYIVCIFALIGGYIGVSSVDLGASIFLQAPDRLHAERANAARGIVIHTPTGQLYVAAKSEFSIAGKSVGTTETKGTGHMHARLEPAAGSAGTQSLAVHIEHPLMEPFDATSDVEVVKAANHFEWPAGTSRVSEDEQAKPKEWEGPFHVRMIPPDGEIPRGLATNAYLLVTDAETEEPVQATIAVSKVEGMLGAAPKSVQSDRLGIARFPVTATTNARVTLDVADANGRTAQGTVRLNAVASQFALRTDQLLVLPGRPVQAAVETLHRSGGLLVDFYDGQRWAIADAFGIGPDGAGLRVIAPEKIDAPLVRLQVYGDFFEAGDAWDSRWLAPSKGNGPTDCVQALRNVLQLHQTQNETLAKWAAAALASPQVDDVSACQRRLDAVLLAVPHEFIPPPVRFNTKKDDLAELDAWRKDIQQKLLIATTGVLLVGFSIVLLFVIQGLRRREEQAATLRELELETAELDEITTKKVDLDQLVLVVQTLIIVLTLLTFGASLLMLMTWL